MMITTIRFTVNERVHLLIVYFQGLFYFCGLCDSASGYINTVSDRRASKFQPTRKLYSPTSSTLNMTSITPFKATDLLRLTSVNLDALTENYHPAFYLQYLTQWPSMFFKSENPNGQITGYMMGKSESPGKEWHSHITAVTVAYDYRRLGLARLLVEQLRRASEAADQDCYFMDLFVRASNKLAIDMYKKFGFHVFRRVERYYGSGDNPHDGEDAFDMRMPLKRDVDKESLKKSSWTEESPYYKYRYDVK